MHTRAGSCACGKIGYELTGEPLFTHACHCTDCQRRSGAAFCLSMMLEAQQLEITAGTLAGFPKTATSGALKTVYFCAGCGIIIYGHTTEWPGIIWIRPGTLEDTSWVAAQAHIWTRSKQPWLTLPAGQPIFLQDYDTAKVWPEQSLARLGNAVAKATESIPI